MRSGVSAMPQPYISEADEKEAAVEDELPSLQDVMERAHEVQQRLLLAHEELAETELTRTAGDGLVAVTIRGNGAVAKVVFDQAAIDQGDAESLATLTLAAIQRAQDAVKSLGTEKMALVAEGFGGALGESARDYPRR